MAATLPTTTRGEASDAGRARRVRPRQSEVSGPLGCAAVPSRRLLLRIGPIAAVTLMAAVCTMPLVPVGAATTQAAAIPPLSFLHVVTPASGPDLTPYLADAAGREVQLRGAAAVGMEDVAYPNADGGPAIFPVAPSAYDGRCPKASPLIPQPPLCEVQAPLSAFAQSTAPGSGDDFAQMRALGFDVVRLVLNWSQLEPTPGTYSATYLNRVVQVVGWARQQGIYVILDMHQDQYSPLHPPGQEGHRSVGLHSVRRWRRRARLGGAGRRQAGLRDVRDRRAEPGRVGLLLQLLAGRGREALRRVRHPGPACRTTTSAPWRLWRDGSRTPRPYWATSS